MDIEDKHFYFNIFIDIKMSRYFGSVNVTQQLCINNLCSTPVVNSTTPIKLQNSIIAVPQEPLASVSLGNASREFGEVRLKRSTLFIGDASISSDTSGSLITNSINTDCISLASTEGNIINMVVTNSGIEVTGITGYIGVVGPTGLEGENGFQGPIGEKGPTGQQGPIGEKGIQGFTGSIGIPGSASFTGPTGPVGPTGSVVIETLLTNTSINPSANISFLGNTTYTLTSGNNGFEKNMIDINDTNDISASFQIKDSEPSEVRLNSTGSNLQSIWSSSLSKWVITSYQGATGASGFKTFVIDHPFCEDRYLVHACLEGPEAGIYYRGIGEIKEGEEYCEIELPNYVVKIANNFTIQITPIFNGKIRTLNFSEVNNNKFNVYGQSGRFYWQVYGEMSEIETEPLKRSKELKGDGPYKWL